METINKELKVSALENGTVLDHIPAENVYKALDILGLKGIGNQITIGINLNSKLFEKKGIIKIADRFFQDDELNKLAEKKKLAMPHEITGIAKCMNPKCITNHQPVRTRFTVLEEDGEISLLCHYCEKRSDIKSLF